MRGMDCLQKTNSEQRSKALSACHVHGQGVFCRQHPPGIKAGLMQEAEKEQEKAIPRVLTLEGSERCSWLYAG